MASLSTEASSSTDPRKHNWVCPSSWLGRVQQVTRQLLLLLISIIAPIRRSRGGGGVGSRSNPCAYSCWFLLHLLSHVIFAQASIQQVSALDSTTSPRWTVVVPSAAFHHSGSITSSTSRRGSLDDLIASLGVDDHEKSTLDLLMGDFTISSEEPQVESGNIPSGIEETKAPSVVPVPSPSTEDVQNMAVSTSVVKQKDAPSTSTQRRKSRKRKSKKKKANFENPLVILMRAAQQLSPNFMLPILTSKIPTPQLMATPTTSSQSGADVGGEIVEEVNKKTDSDNDSPLLQVRKSPESFSFPLTAANVMVEPNRVIPRITPRLERQMSSGSPSGSPKGSNSESSDALSVWSPEGGDNSPQRNSQSAPGQSGIILFSPAPTFDYSSEDGDIDMEKPSSTFIAPATFVIESLVPLYKEFENNDLKAMFQRRKRLPSFHTIKKRRLPRSAFMEADGPMYGAKRYKVEGDTDSFNVRHLVQKRSISNDARLPLQNPRMTIPQQQQVPSSSLPLQGASSSLPQQQNVPISLPKQQQLASSLPRQQLITSSSFPQQQLLTGSSLPRQQLLTASSFSQQQGSPASSSLAQQPHKSAIPSTPISMSSPQVSSAQGGPLMSPSAEQKTTSPILPHPPQSQSAGPIPYNYQQQVVQRPAVSTANQWQAPPQGLSPLQQQLARAPINANVGGSPNNINVNYNNNMRSSTPIQPVGNKQVPTSSDDSVFKAPLPVSDYRQRISRPNTAQTPFPQPPQQQGFPQNYQRNMQPQHQQMPVTSEQQRLRQQPPPQYPPHSQLASNPGQQYQYPVMRDQQVINQQQQRLYNEQQQQNRYPDRQYYGGPPQSQHTPGQYAATPSRQSFPSHYGTGSQQPSNSYLNPMLQQKQLSPQMASQYPASAQSSYQREPYNRIASPYPVPSSYYPGRDSSMMYPRSEQGHGYPGNNQASVRVPPSSSYMQQQQSHHQPYEMQNRLYNDPFSKGTGMEYRQGAMGVPDQYGANTYTNSPGYPRVGTPIPGQSNSRDFGQHNYGSTQQHGYPVPIPQRSGTPAPLSPLQRQLQQPVGYPNTIPGGNGIQSIQQQQYYGGPIPSSRVQSPSQYFPYQPPNQQQGQQPVATVDRFRAGTPLLPQRPAFQPQPPPNYYSPGKSGGRGSAYPESAFQNRPISTATNQQPSFGPAGQGQRPTSSFATSRGDQQVSSTPKLATDYTKNIASNYGVNFPTIGNPQNINSPQNLRKPETSPPTAPATPIPPEVISGGERVLFRPRSGGPQPQADGLGGVGRGRGAQEPGRIGTGGNRGEFTLPIIDNPQAKSQLQRQQELSRQPLYHQPQQQSGSSGQQQQWSLPGYSGSRSQLVQQQQEQAPGKSGGAKNQTSQQQPTSTSGGPGANASQQQIPQTSPANLTNPQPSQQQPASTSGIVGGPRTNFSQQQPASTGNMEGPTVQSSQQQTPSGNIGGVGNSSGQSIPQQQALSGNSRGEPREQSNEQYQTQQAGQNDGRQPIQISGGRGGNVTASRGNNYYGYGTGQSERLPPTYDRWNDIDVRYRNSTPWGPTGNGNDNGGSGQAPQVPRPDTPQVQTTARKVQEGPFQGPQESGGGYQGRRLPHHGGDMPFYSQSEVDAHHERVSHNSQTTKDTEFENDSKILSWYLQRAKQKLRDRQEAPSHKKYDQEASTGYQTLGRGSSSEQRAEFQPSSIQQGYASPAQFNVSYPYSSAIATTRPATPQYNSAQASIPSASAYDRGLSSISNPSQMVQAPPNTTALHGSAAQSGFNPNANQNGLSPLSRTAPSSPASSSSIASSYPTGVQGDGSQIGIGSGILQSGQSNSGNSTSQSNPSGIPERNNDDRQTRTKRNLRNPYEWYFP